MGCVGFLRFLKSACACPQWICVRKTLSGIVHEIYLYMYNQLVNWNRSHPFINCTTEWKAPFSDMVQSIQLYTCWMDWTSVLFVNLIVVPPWLMKSLLMWILGFSTERLKCTKIPFPQCQKKKKCICLTMDEFHRSVCNHGYAICLPFVWYRGYQDVRVPATRWLLSFLLLWLLRWYTMHGSRIVWCIAFCTLSSAECPTHVMQNEITHKIVAVGKKADGFYCENEFRYSLTVKEI